MSTDTAMISSSADSLGEARSDLSLGPRLFEKIGAKEFRNLLDSLLARTDRFTMAQLVETVRGFLKRKRLTRAEDDYLRLLLPLCSSLAPLYDSNYRLLDSARQEEHFLLVHADPASLPGEGLAAPAASTPSDLAVIANDLFETFFKSEREEGGNSKLVRAHSTIIVGVSANGRTKNAVQAARVAFFAAMAAARNDGVSIRLVTVYGPIAQEVVGFKVPLGKTAVGNEFPFEPCDSRGRTIRDILPRLARISAMTDVDPCAPDVTNGIDNPAAKARAVDAQSTVVLLIALDTLAITQAYNAIVDRIRKGRCDKLEFLSLGEVFQLYALDNTDGLEIVLATLHASSFSERLDLHLLIKRATDFRGGLWLNRAHAVPIEELEGGGRDVFIARHDDHEIQVAPLLVPTARGYAFYAPSNCPTCGGVIGYLDIVTENSDADIAVGGAFALRHHLRMVARGEAYVVDGTLMAPPTNHVMDRSFPLPLPEGLKDLVKVPQFYTEKKGKPVKIKARIDFKLETLILARLVRQSLVQGPSWAAQARF
ncbi:hypothetical protein BMF94_7006 [Rhodotorula taiwanensis]|uniref:Uncharacterized protein n=1 Tax=Rhodotorula taiwanensis TaxID=741276 RepID=A0A2S5AZJ2_9BASI|nr:hypothetical protein BMF94_7006 [Rhodotorula taiwanensis]